MSGLPSEALGYLLTMFVYASSPFGVLYIPIASKFCSGLPQTPSWKWEPEASEKSCAPLWSPWAMTDKRPTSLAQTSLFVPRVPQRCSLNGSFSLILHTWTHRARWRREKMLVFMAHVLPFEKPTYNKSPSFHRLRLHKSKVLMHITIHQEKEQGGSCRCGLYLQRLRYRLPQQNVPFQNKHQERSKTWSCHDHLCMSVQRESADLHWKEGLSSWR